MKKIAFYNKIFPIFASDMIRLSQSGLCLSLHQPQDGFYKGTRFDRSGVFGSLLFQGTEFCGPWFTSYSPTLHDAVQGPAEEFSPIGLPDGRILKIGVGLLKADMAAYDRFCLYPVLDAGQWTVEADGWQARFEHRLEGFYRYEKVISLQGGGRFSIGHSLTPEFPWRPMSITTTSSPWGSWRWALPGKWIFPSSRRETGGPCTIPWASPPAASVFIGL